MKPFIVLTVALSLFSSNASATWFARAAESAGLVITGIAVNPDGTITPAYFTCKADTFDVEILTSLNAKVDDLPMFEGVTLVFAYQTRRGETKKMNLSGTPISSAGGALSITAKLDKSQSATLAESIGFGNRLDVDLVHPEITDDRGTKTIYSDGFTTATLAMAEHCPGLGA